MASVMNSRTITGLKRWSCQVKGLPAVSQIKAVHVYDFDNTLFTSPLPNPKLWNGPTIGLLSRDDAFSSGGWWHDARILAATGEGVEKEERKAWQGWWNEHIVSLVELTMQQKDALNVLLTGRAEAAFGDLLKRMTKSKGLEFDMICLKPEVGPNNQRFPSTLRYKQALLEDIIYTYREAEEIRVYEDRPKHVQSFRDFFTDLNSYLLNPEHSSLRRSIVAEVIKVTDGVKYLDPVVETAEVQRMINEHNSSLARGVRAQCGHMQIKQTVFFTGYLISPNLTQQLLSLVHLPANMPESEVKPLANNIMIMPRLCPKNILDRVGGMGRKVSWEVTGVSMFENRVWAAAVRPVPETAKIYTDSTVPMVVLALRKGARPADASRIQNWQPVPTDKPFVFETVVGEKVLLRVEEDDARDHGWDGQYGSRENKRRYHHDGDGEQHSRQRFHQQASRGNQRGHQHQGYNNSNTRGGRGASQRGNRGNAGQRGNGRGGCRGRGRGGGAAHGHKHVDDPPQERSYSGSHAQASGNYGGPQGLQYDDFQAGPGDAAQNMLHPGGIGGRNAHEG